MLAIVIPYYNINYFEETLKSLATQTDQRFKVYIGNDVSSNNPEDLIEKYKPRVNITYKKFEKNLGQASLIKHWERCIDLIEEEGWIQVLGDDDVLSINFVAQFYHHLKTIENKQIQVIRFASEVIDEKSDKKSMVFKHPQLELATDAYFRRFKGTTRSSLSEYIFSKACYYKYGFYKYPLGWHVDDMAWLDFTNCGKIYAINEAVASIRLSKTSISGKAINFKEKQEATYLFFMNLIAKKIKYFNALQQIELLNYFQKMVFKRKQLTYHNWSLIAINLMKKEGMLSVVKFSRQFIKHKFK